VGSLTTERMLEATDGASLFPVMLVQYVGPHPARKSAASDRSMTAIKAH